jgi:(2Fe-2S) ferredoxin
MGKNLAISQHTFLFCEGGACKKAGSENVIRHARAYLRNSHLWDSIHTIKTMCNGRCEDAPTCVVLNGGFWYKDLTPQNVVPILESHIIGNKLMVENLLYQKGWDKVESDNERAKVKPKPFVLKEDSELGRCYITKGFSSDQYIFPLFQFLHQVNDNTILKLANKEQFKFNELLEIKYDDKYKMELIFKTNSIEFTISFVPKTEPMALVKQKITSTDYFIAAETEQKGIRFKNKMGETVALIYIDKTDTQVWEYCLTIQLLGISEPIKHPVNV